MIFNFLLNLLKFNKILIYKLIININKNARPKNERFDEKI